MEPIVFRVNVSRWITEGWDLFLKELGTLVAIGAISVILLHLPFLWGPVWTALLYAATRLAESGRVALQDYLDGYKFFLPALLSSLLILLLTAVGLLFLVVPGLVIFSMYIFAPLYICQQKMTFLEAMGASRRLVSRDYFGFTLFMLVLVLLNLLGMAFFYVGLVFSLPVSACALVLAYREAAGLPTPALTPPGPDSRPVVIE